MLKSLLSAVALISLAACDAPATNSGSKTSTQENTHMSTITTKDGNQLYYKDWGPKDAQPIVFHHGWPLTSDDWDNQMLFFLSNGYRVVAFDRRGQGRSTQTDTGHDMDTFASDTADLVAALDLKNTVQIGHSTGGGVVARYVAQAEPGRVSKAVLIGAITPILGKTESNPTGIPLEVFDGFRKALIDNRSQYYLDLPSGPFYGFNRPGAEVSQGLIQNWWRQGMAGSAKAQLDTITAFSETDFTEDLKAITVPVLVLHGEDDQIVPVDETARRAVALLPNGSLKTYPGLPHGLFATHPDVVNADLLAFIRN
ncbi:alpha/beta fold hydrolase [Phenylobacterium sp.]|uniref:alpha/beta fold hydrolase n=2 Tax=Alphaproteobacteria TaxID=28211 RepID=UPI00351F8A1E